MSYPRATSAAVAGRTTRIFPGPAGGRRRSPALSWQDASDDLLRSALAPLGRALADHALGDADAVVTVHVEGEPPEPLPAAYFLRQPSRMGPVDRTALDLARGRVLDVGACAGAHAIPLQRLGHEVTALELLPEAVGVLRGRGVRDVVEGSVWSFRPRRSYDTVLALMNGTALAGTLPRLEALLARFRELLAADGQVLLDSTSLEDEDEEPCELHYQLEYGGERGPPFPQLFLGERALAQAARDAGLSMELVAREEERYLACLRRASPTV